MEGKGKDINGRRKGIEWGGAGIRVMENKIKKGHNKYNLFHFTVIGDSTVFSRDPL